jgi:methylated-DNA-protein-cysteine methyltransferase-like protein
MGKTPAPGLDRNAAFRRVILGIPKGRVATYGQVAAVAGYPRNHRAVAQFLRSEPPNRLPWHRVVGAGGEIKLQGEGAAEQRLRLRMEGIQFAGRRVNMKVHEYRGRARG